MILGRPSGWPRRAWGVAGLPIRLVYSDSTTFDFPANFALDDESLSTRRAAFAPSGAVYALPVDQLMENPVEVGSYGSYQ